MSLDIHHLWQRDPMMNSRPGVAINSGGKNGKSSNSPEPNPCAPAVSTAFDAQFQDPRIAATALLQAPMAVIVCDEDSKIVIVNELARRMSRASPDGGSMTSGGTIWGDLFKEDGTPDHWPSADSLYGQVITNQERQLVSHSGEQYQVLINAGPIVTPRGQVLGAVIMLSDVTNNRRQETIRRLQAIASERTRIAGNIHDNVSQGLNAAVLQIRAARKEVLTSVRLTRGHLRKALEWTLYSLAEAQRSTSVLSYEFGASDNTADVLRNIASQLFSGSNVKLEFAVKKPALNLPQKLQQELVRIGKEALTNSCKHANASRILVSLGYDTSNSELKIVDNGSGFALTPRSMPKVGFGLLSMQARAEGMGGRVEIRSRPAQGTSVIVILPLSDV
jgi:signal transduction histidine kinase